VQLSIMKEEIININDVSFAYSKQDVVKNITLTIHKGEFVGLIGPNGSGKTTLLKIMLGLLEPNKGSVKLFDKPIKKFKDWSKIGYVPQKATNIDKNFPATVQEIVLMGLLSTKKIPKIITQKDNQKIQNALELTNITNLSKARITDLSGGQQQRALIAKALVSNPLIILLDEPTTGVDQKTQENFYKLLAKLNKKGITIVLVTHDIGRITRNVTKVASINQKLTFFGNHKEFCAKDKNHPHEHTLCIHGE